MKTIERGEQYDLDHVIPRGFFADIDDAKERRKFEQLWNVQPMHRSCHEAHRSGQLWGFPVFQCTCHSLHIEDRVLYLRHEGRAVAKLYEITPAVVNMNVGGRVVPVQMMSSVGSIGSKRYKAGKYTHGKVGRNAGHRVGHRLPALTDDQIDEFNRLEGERVAGAVAASIAKFNSMRHSDTGIVSDGMSIEFESRSR